jgi:uncharacterized RDD family membrane protein YckC
MTDRQTIIVAPRPAPTPPQPDWADAWAHPEYFRGVTMRRVLAYVIDGLVVLVLAIAVWVATGLLTVLSFGLLAPLQALAVALVPLAYHSLLIAAPGSATLGMRLFGLKVRSIATDQDARGGRPTVLQAIIQVVTFYGSIAATGSLILIVALFNARRRTLHDWLAGTIVIKVPQSA